MAADMAAPSAENSPIPNPEALADDMRAPLMARLLAFADDELLLAQRDGEWTGHAPILEEDIALANLAQDELGHAQLYYQLYEALSGQAPDSMVYQREAAAWRNVQLVELPNGDWAQTMLRHYLFDCYEACLLPALATSRYTPLAEVAATIRKEERFHLQHSALWVKRLGLGTEESQRRVQQALDLLWPYTPQLFAPLTGDAALQAAGILPDIASVQALWQEHVQSTLQHASLVIPQALQSSPSREQHSPHLAPVIATLQEVAQLAPVGSW